MMNNKTLLENIPFGVILHNSDGLIIDANKLVEKILKISLNEIIGKKWSNLSFKVVNKEGVECVIEEAIVKDVLTSGRDVKDQVVSIVHPSNRNVIWINITILFKPAEVGSKSEQNQALMYISDVTDIIKTNVAIENTIDNLNLGTWQWDIELGTLIFNDKWVGMLGYTLEELSFSNIDVWHKLIHPDDFKTMEDSLQDHFEGKSPQYYCEIRLHHKNGQWVWVRHFGKVTLWSDKGKPLYMSGMHQDISDFKKNELHLSRKIEYGKILSDISTNFINTHDIDATIIESFSKIALLNEASRIYLFRFDEEKQTMSNTHEWCSEGVSPQKDILQDLPLTDFPWWIKKLSDGEIINISDVSKMPLEASAEKEILEYQSVKSIFVLPVVIKQSLVGFIGFDNV
ncbi:MAG TPA: PAS domain-containing protein, partial [Bacteroidales bacterium]|nr:PAS domain-containing protein [Bacteroidales bacterium]